MLNNGEGTRFEDFKITNKQRNFFGLEPILDTWDVVEIRKGYWIYFEGNIIKKIINIECFRNISSYQEEDHNIETVERKQVIPKTARGKVKKLIVTNIQNRRPTGMSFYINFDSEKGTIACFNKTNQKSIPIRFIGKIESQDDWNNWIAGYMNSCPEDYFDRLEIIKSSPHVTIKYKTGDIFRFDIDREYYGFGIIIGNIRKQLKKGMYPQEHPMQNLMMMPLLIRVYRIKTKDKYYPFKELIKKDLSPVYIIADNDIIWGVNEILYNKRLEERDVEFPEHYQKRFPSINKKDKNVLAWGTGIILKGRSKKDKNLKEYSNRGVSTGIQSLDILNYIDGKSDGYNKHFRMFAKENEENRIKTFKFFNLKSNITFNEFAKKTGGMTRKEYIDYIYENNIL